MSLPIKFICRKNKIRKDGTAPVFIQYCYSSEKRILLNTGIYIPPNCWNKKSNGISQYLPPEYGEPEELESKLSVQWGRAESIIKKSLKQHLPDPLPFIKEQFYHENDRDPGVHNLLREPVHRTGKTIFQHMEDYMTEKKTSVKKCTLTVISSMAFHLKSYEDYLGRPITFDSIDVRFYEGFVRFLTYKIRMPKRKSAIYGLKVNTIGKTIKWLKSFLQDRMHKKIIPFFDTGFLKAMQEDVDSIYLDWKEISSIYHLNLTEHPHLEKYRDLFVVGCLTGLRFSDYSELRPEEIRDGMLHVIQEKTKSMVVIPVRREVQKILVDKYQMRMPQVSNPDFNYYIKEVAKLAGINAPIKIIHKRGNQTIEDIRPKYAWVCSHTCRRSFCTNEYLEDTPIDLIMSVSGHKTEKAFRKYVKATQVQKALKIRELWLSRPEL